MIISFISNMNIKRYVWLHYFLIYIWVLSSVLTCKKIKIWTFCIPIIACPVMYLPIELMQVRYAFLLNFYITQFLDALLLIDFRIEQDNQHQSKIVVLSNKWEGRLLFWWPPTLTFNLLPMLMTDIHVW